MPNETGLSGNNRTTWEWPCRFPPSRTGSLRSRLRRASARQAEKAVGFGSTQTRHPPHSFARFADYAWQCWCSQERGVGVGISLPQPHSGEGGPYLANFRRATRVSRASQRARISVSTDLISPSSPRASGSPVGLESSSAVTSVTGFSSRFPLVSVASAPHDRSTNEWARPAARRSGRDVRVGIARIP